MSLQKRKVRETTLYVEELNRKFQGRTLITSQFYRILESHGLIISKCLLVKLFPDGGNTYCGTIISQEGEVLEFDIDLDDPSYSEWKDKTDEFLRHYKKNREHKPWDLEVVCYDFYKDTHTS